MTEKTRLQIEAMKNQTIGVEIEMAKITRERACRTVAKFYGTEHTVYRNGNRWYCTDTQNRKWTVACDSSISGDGAELITPILTYADIEDLQKITRLLRKAGAKSNPSLGCGVHIHIGADGHTPQSLRNLAIIMASHEHLLARAINIDSHRLNNYCKAVDPTFLARLNATKPSTMSDLAEIWYSTLGNNDRGWHYNRSRYHMLNLHATFTKGTIEFRLFQFDNPSETRKGGLHAGQLKSYIQLCLALSQAAKAQKSALPRRMQTENSRFAMRTWLVRLGFIGDEFKTARDLFTKRLDGDPAFRFGRTA